MLSSFVSYFSLSESAAQKGPTAEELEATRKAQICVQDCQLESLIADSKFLHIDSLTDLVKVGVGVVWVLLIVTVKIGGQRVWRWCIIF